MERSVLEVVCDVTKMYSDLDTVSSSTRFYGDGIDSLEVIQIVVECESELNIDVPDTMTYDPSLTVGSLVVWIEAEQAKKA